MSYLMNRTTQPALPQAAMVRALRATLETSGGFGDAFAAMPGFVAQTLPDGIQVGTNAAHQTGAVIAPTIAALTCAHASLQEIATRVVNAGFSDTTLAWEFIEPSADDTGPRASATFEVSHSTNLKITCLEETVDPYFDGRKFDGATIILQLVQVSKRPLH